MASKPTPKVVNTPTPISHSYRAYRLDTFSWQAYRVTTLSDGTSTEEAIFKPDLIEIVIQKIGREIRKEGQVQFHAKKKVI